MAAVIDIRTGANLTDASALLEPGRTAERPQFRVVQGGRSIAGRRRRQVFLVRRAVVLAAVAIALLLGAQVVTMVGTAFAGSGAPGSSVSSIDASAPYVVQPGDTLWAVAQGVAPSSDPRDVIEQIVQLNAIDGVELSADSPLRVGQHLVLPTDLH